MTVNSVLNGRDMNVAITKMHGSVSKQVWIATLSCMAGYL